MIHYVYAEQLPSMPLLKGSMFRDRAEQFRRRLRWDVEVDDNGWEVDAYDMLNPLYAVWLKPDGTHGGSLRILPTVGQTMTADYFLHLTNGVRISSPLIWECTRFCISPGATANVAPSIILAGIEFGLRSGIEQAVGVIYAKTLPLYHRLGWIPDIIGQDGCGSDRIVVCLWDISERGISTLCDKAGISRRDVANWIDNRNLYGTEYPTTEDSILNTNEKNSFSLVDYA